MSRRVQTDEQGNYTLAGLPPGTYKVEVTGPTGAVARLVTLQVGQTASLDLGLAAAQENIESVTVTATQLYETRTSEVATYVTPKQIEALPQNSRNFLAFADTVPGVQFVTSADGATSEIRSGAQAANGVNVFIDGVGQKNYVLRGGVSGQTLSRGNPFPQLAIGEYKVITSNYKAEFDQLSSAAVVAVTRSGTNEFESKAFYDHTSENWRASDPNEKRAGRKADSEQDQYGIAFGGPIIHDRMHFFVTYEGKEFETPKNDHARRGHSLERCAAGAAEPARRSQRAVRGGPVLRQDRLVGRRRSPARADRQAARGERDLRHRRPEHRDRSRATSRTKRRASTCATSSPARASSTTRTSPTRMRRSIRGR